MDPLSPIIKTLLEVAVVLLLGVAVGWAINGWRLQHQIDALKLTQANNDKAETQAAIHDIVAVAANMHEQAQNYLVKTADIEAGLAKIHKELQNAKPLPVDCKPDDFRMRHLHDAVRQLQDTLAGAHK